MEEDYLLVWFGLVVVKIAKKKKKKKLVFGFFWGKGWWGTGVLAERACMYVYL